MVASSIPGLGTEPCSIPSVLPSFYRHSVSGGWRWGSFDPVRFGLGDSGDPRHSHLPDTGFNSPPGMQPQGANRAGGRMNPNLLAGMRAIRTHGTHPFWMARIAFPFEIKGEYWWHASSSCVPRRNGATPGFGRIAIELFAFYSYGYGG